MSLWHGVFIDKSYPSWNLAFPRQSGPIAATAFSKTGSIFAYAISYDWSKGYTGMVPNHPNKVMLHNVKDDDIKKKPRK